MFYQRTFDVFRKDQKGALGGIGLRCFSVRNKMVRSEGRRTEIFSKREVSKNDGRDIT